MRAGDLWLVDEKEMVWSKDFNHARLFADNFPSFPNERRIGADLRAKLTYIYICRTDGKNEIDIKKVPPLTVGEKKPAYGKKKTGGKRGVWWVVKVFTDEGAHEQIGDDYATEQAAIAAAEKTEAKINSALKIKWSGRGTSNIDGEVYAGKTYIGRTYYVLRRANINTQRDGAN